MPCLKKEKRGEAVDPAVLDGICAQTKKKKIKNRGSTPTSWKEGKRRRGNILRQSFSPEQCGRKGRGAARLGTTLSYA